MGIASKTPGLLVAIRPPNTLSTAGSVCHVELSLLHCTRIWIDPADEGSGTVYVRKSELSLSTAWLVVSTKSEVSALAPPAPSPQYSSPEASKDMGQLWITGTILSRSIDYSVVQCRNE